MRNFATRPAMLLLALVLAACSTTPTTTSLLDQARGDYMAAQNDPIVQRYAASELSQAGDALSQANTAATKNDSLDKIDKLAYIAKQKVAMTEEVAKRRQAEADVASADKQQQELRLEQRTHEADRAAANAEQAKLAAQQAQADAANAQRQTDEAQRQAQAARDSAARLEAQLADLQAKQTARGLVITLNDVLFGTDMANLTPDGLRTVQKLAEVLQQNPQRTVLIEGYTDSTGTLAHNQELSERRATSVRLALQGLGVGPDRVAVRGYGPSYPVAPNDTASNRQLNRRVEIVLSDDSGHIAQR